MIIKKIYNYNVNNSDPFVTKVRWKMNSVSRRVSYL